MSKDKNLSESYATFQNFDKVPQSLLLLVELKCYYTRRNWTTTKGYALLCRAEACWKLLSSYLHVESQYNETHVLTVDTAPGADLLLNEIPRKKEQDEKREKKKKREAKHSGEWAKGIALCEAAFRIGDIRPWRSNQDHDSFDDVRLSWSCRQNAKKFHVT